MAAKSKNARKQTGRSAARKRSESGAPFNNQDVQRRLGDFVGAGEHARKGGRTSGIVGQTTKKLRTDHRQP